MNTGTSTGLFCLATLIQQGISDGTLRKINPEVAARVFVSLALGLLMQAMFDPQEVIWKKETQQRRHDSGHWRRRTPGKRIGG